MKTLECNDIDLLFHVKLEKQGIHVFDFNTSNLLYKYWICKQVIP